MIYDLLITLGAAFALPKWLLQTKYKGSLKERFGIKLPPAPKGKPVIWMHGVSMGETKVLIPLYNHLATAHPNATFYISGVTKTGHEEAKKRFPNANHFYLPLDHSHIMGKLHDQIQPDLFVLSESDFWYNQLRLCKERGVKTLLINGKISDRSAARFQKVPHFAKSLFSNLDHLCVQNDDYRVQFQKLGVLSDRITVTGNLKLAIPPKLLSNEERASWRKKLGIQEGEKVITIGSTHEGEEELLISQMPTSAKILLVPRHPERFEEVKKRFHGKNVVVVDQMGVLTICYQLSDLAIVGGSFVPGIGGHNIYEPVQAGIPVVFGPYMEQQKELVELVLSQNVGIQLEASELAKALNQADQLFENARSLSTREPTPLQKTLPLLPKELGT